MYQTKNLITSGILICCLTFVIGCTSSSDQTALDQDSTVDATQVSQTEPAQVNDSASLANNVQQQLIEPAPADQLAQPQTDSQNQVVQSGLNSNSGKIVSTLRVWRDRDFQYSTNAELLEVSIQSKTVKLLKENGVTITVPINRLSNHDRNFLAQFVAPSN